MADVFKMTVLALLVGVAGLGLRGLAGVGDAGEEAIRIGALAPGAGLGLPPPAGSRRGQHRDRRPRSSVRWVVQPWFPLSSFASRDRPVGPHRTGPAPPAYGPNATLYRTAK